MSKAGLWPREEPRPTDSNAEIRVYDVLSRQLPSNWTAWHSLSVRTDKGSEGEGDFVIAFYNPVSRRRRTLLAEARDILLRHRPADTPVLLASSLGRPDEMLRYRKLEDLQVDEIDMLTVVIVGSSQTRLAKLGEGPRMFTPRGYARKIDGDLSVVDGGRDL